MVVSFIVWGYYYYRLFYDCKFTAVTQTGLYMIYGYLYPNH